MNYIYGAAKSLYICTDFSGIGFNVLMQICHHHSVSRAEGHLRALQSYLQIILVVVKNPGC